MTFATSYVYECDRCHTIKATPNDSNTPDKWTELTFCTVREGGPKFDHEWHICPECSNQFHAFITKVEPRT